MKTNQIFNWISFFLASLGVLFKTMHWPGANIVLLVALLVLIISSILSFGSNKQTGLGDTLNYCLTLALLILVVGAGFNIFHWPGSFAFRVIGQLIFVILPIIMLLANKDNKVSNSFWVTFLIYVMLVISMTTSKIDSMNEKMNAVEKTESHP